MGSRRVLARKNVPSSSSEEDYDDEDGSEEEIEEAEMIQPKNKNLGGKRMREEKPKEKKVSLKKRD